MMAFVAHHAGWCPSERLARSEAAGQRQKEACSINKSLSRYPNEMCFADLQRRRCLVTLARSS